MLVRGLGVGLELHRGKSIGFAGEGIESSKTEASDWEDEHFSCCGMQIEERAQ
jgi:hypothetical protein